MARIRKQKQTYQTGEKGSNRVRVFPHKSGKLFLEYRRAGRRIRKSLGHVEWTRAKQEADDLAAQLRRPDHREAVALAMLFDNYLREMTPTKSVGKQRHDRLATGLMVRVLGGNRLAGELTHRDAARYAAERRRMGDLRAGKGGSPIGMRQVAYDLRFLRAVLNWGIGAGWLDRNPLAGYVIQEAPSPRRPAFTEEQYQSLLGVADQLPDTFRLLLVLAHDTGHRIGALLALRWNDVDLTAGRIRWRAASDKIGWEHTTPLTAAARAVLMEAPGIGDALVAQGVSRHLARDWMERAQNLAGLPPEKGRGWHALRRQFASELRHAPLRDLCDLGGWRNPQTVVKCYQRPSEEAQRAALETRKVLQA